jgi:hypothetical protein
MIAQSIGRVGTTAAPFLKIGVGARGLAMGEAYVTQAEDATGMFWNPAGIANIAGNQIVLNHYDYIADLNYEFGGFAMNVGNIGTFGLFVSYLGMPDIERTTIDFPMGTGEKVGASSFVAGLTYAKALTDRFLIGGNVKFVKETIWHSSAEAIAFDVGLLYRTEFKNIKIGMSISNFGTEMKMSGRDILVQHDINTAFEGNNENINAHLDTDSFPLPILFRVGISADIARNFFDLEQYGWIVAVDAVHHNDNYEYMNIGTEVNLYNLISLRGGYRQLLLENSEGGLSLGFGVQVDIMSTQLEIDYANIDYGRLDHQNKFTLTISF